MSIVPFGDHDGVLKVEAINCILTYLQEGAAGDAIDLRVIIDRATPDSVLFLVEYGGERPASFYYNKPDHPDDEGYISIEKRKQRLNPTLFVAMFYKLREMECTNT